MGSANIGWAVHQLLEGQKVCRSGWNGKNMWLEIDQSVNDDKGASRKHYPRDNFVWMKTAQNTYIPWLCSQTDLLATDWEIVE